MRIPLILFCLLIGAAGYAHGDLDERIAALNEQITASPNNAQLYLKRGQLHAQHRDYAPARQDYHTARQLEETLIITDYLLAKIDLDTRQWSAGLTRVAAYLAERPRDPQALILRAGLLRGHGDAAAGAADLAAALDHLSAPAPRHYTTIAETVLAADSLAVDEALAWLDRGQARFAFDIVLQSKRVELLRGADRYDEALTTIDLILTALPRTEKWTFERAAVLEAAGRSAEARQAYQSTLEQIRALPSRLQHSARVLQLEADALGRLQVLTEIPTTHSSH